MATIVQRDRAKGKISFIVYYRDPEGNQKTKSFTSKNSTTKEINKANRYAEKFANTIEAQKELGILEVEKNITFKTYSENFMQIHLHNLRQNTRKTYTNYLGYINKIYGYRKIGDITASELDKFFLTLKNERKLKMSSIKLYRDVFNLVFKSAKNKRIIKNNPMLELDFKFTEKDKKKVKKTVDHETLKIILKSFDAIYYVFLILLGIMTGLRRGELCALKWSKNIDFENRVITVTNSIDEKGNLGPTKTTSSMRTIYMFDNLLFLLQYIKRFQQICIEKLGNTYKNDDFVLCKYDGSFLNINTVSKTMYEKSQTYGVHFTMHMLRHTFATMLKTANIKDVQALLGHANAEITVNTYQEYQQLENSTIEMLNNSIDPTIFLK